MNSASYEITGELIIALRNAKYVAVLTGAGISAESGIPTFRDAQVGLWAQYDPEDLATPDAFARDPRLVWEWYAWRRSLVEQAQPNPGHLALAEMERRVPQFTLITQNVDGLHRRAGSKHVLELHGNITRVKCSVEQIFVEDWPATSDVPPRCPQCLAMLRPAVVWFGERLPEQENREAFTAAAECDLFLSIGTSALVQPAASLPRVAQRSGASVAIINPDSAAQRYPGAYSVEGPAGEVLPALLKAVWPDLP